ncbi:MAG: hypothetical protein AB7O28_10860 [Vicinamibacterales bacterium]
MSLGYVRTVNVACIVADDPGEVVRGARPTSDRDRVRLDAQARERTWRALGSRGRAAAPPEPLPARGSISFVHSRPFRPRDGAAGPSFVTLERT